MSGSSQQHPAPGSRRGTAASTAGQKERTSKAKNRLVGLVWGFLVLYTVQVELYFQLLCIYVDPHPGPRSRGFTGWVQRAPSTEILVTQINKGGSTTLTLPDRHAPHLPAILHPRSSRNELVLITARSNHLMVPVPADCCINVFFKNWNACLLLGGVEPAGDSGRGCLFPMQRGSITKRVCRTVW